MEIHNVASSQIMPVSAFDTQLNVPMLYKQFEQYFFTKGQLPFKVFKSSYTSSLPDCLSKTIFIQSLFNTLETAVRLQIRETSSEQQEKSLSIKEAFEIIANIFKILEKQNLQLEPIILFSALAGFVLAKSRN